MSLEQHEDVDIPLCLRFEVGGLLRSFSEKLSADGFLVEQTQKPPGNHVTSWWLYVTFDATARKKSRVQYGETCYDKVNSVPHLWCRAREKYRRRAVELLRDFVRERATRTAPQTSVVALPPPSPASCAWLAISPQLMCDVVLLLLEQFDLQPAGQHARCVAVHI